MNITVYLGAFGGSDPAFAAAVDELGAWIGKNGHSLVYGGSETGLMGRLALSALAAGAEVTGVEPRFFVEQEVQCDQLTRLIVTEDMPQRKAKMIELGQAFIAMPGGTGTLEEISEVMSLVSLKKLNAPCILYNLDGYYDSLKALLSRMIAAGLSTPERQKGIYFARSLAEIEEILARDKTSLDITWMKSDSGTEDYTLSELLDQIKEKSANIAKAVAALEELIGEVDE